MPSHRSLPAFVALGALAVTGLAACGGKEGKKGDRIGVTATDTECQVARTDLPAGAHTFEVTNKGTKVTEFYLYAEGDRILGEVENIGPGLSRKLIVEATEAGKFQTACKPGMKGDGIRGDFTVTGDSKKSTDGNALLAEATRSYQRYVTSQADQLLVKTEEFVNAVKAGKVDDAKALFPVSRTYWERIEPVAEIFGDLDPLIDGREGDQEEGQDFTGFHRIEKALWETSDISDMGPYADQLQEDVAEIVALADDTTLDPLQLANGAKALLDEVATGKITGEEDRYSHTDLWDFAANLEGSQAAVQALRPFLEEADPDLVGEIDERFAATEAELEQYRSGDGWMLQNELTEDQLRGLSDSITALSESVGRVASVVADQQ